MFEPIRGGTRGGQAEFKWADVSADKDRENYLGHSINAPTGRWQKNKDIHWYNRDNAMAESEREEEIRKIKELEADALAVALGFEPAKKTGATAATSPTTEKNPGASPSASTATGVKNEPNDEQRALEKEEKRRRKEARREEKRAHKEARKAKKESRRNVISNVADDGHYRRRYRSLSRSPRRRSLSPRQRSRSPHYPDIRDTDRRRRSRSRTPVRRITRRDSPDNMKYNTSYREREREKERDGQRWDSNLKRDEPDRRHRYR